MCKRLGLASLSKRAIVKLKFIGGVDKVTIKKEKHTIKNEGQAREKPAIPKRPVSKSFKI